MGSTQTPDRIPQGGSESAQQRNEAAELRDESATLRDEVALLRDEIADLRDTESDPPDRTAQPSGAPVPDLGDGETRDRAGETRDDTAADSDKAAHERDEAADARDQVAIAVERSQDLVSGDGESSREDAIAAREDAASDRRDSEQDRLRAAVERTAAGTDRDASAGDRHHSERDRDGSATDRAEATEEIDAANVDALTGTYARGPGMAELERGLSRASRSGEPMTLAFIDVDDLKGVNDRDGHPAGDRLLRQVADVLWAHTRHHDVIVRYGGDEFVCALVGLTRAESADRLTEVNRELAEASERGSITVGLAELEAGESLQDLIQRADDALYHQRGQR